ncbi:MAG: GNAT family N-acetyltransferase [Oscillospiraceae bacterium]|jgi:GNAT superfamily N-acetyltransferase|nr:GNAT family N-acetyltransferase [Oscillospiraceae bacterium]
MPLPNIPQPQLLPIAPGLRLRRYDGHYEIFLPGYQTPAVYENSEGIFDLEKIPDLGYVKGMCNFLDRAGELYYIEIEESGAFVPIGDVTIKPQNPPIALWREEYRGRGIGRQVMQAVIARLRALGYEKISGSSVFRWNTASQRLHESLGFYRVGENEREFFYDLTL